jgi:Carboxypeptidase regulatory-like domain
MSLILPRIVSPMKPVLACLLVAVLGACALAQNAVPAKSAQRASIEGIVTKDPDSQPVKKAIIELIAENQSEGGDYTATTGVDGSFRIENILPGRYHLYAERTGFLDSGRHRAQPEGRILTLAAGQEVKDLHIRLQAAAVVRGRVTDEDGDPMANAEVTILRQTFISGHSRWEQAGAERTNDLGEYRIANLSAGNVYVSVNPPPDFKSLIEASGANPNQPHNADKAATSYQTTFYPGTTDRSQAAPIQLHAGDDYPVNFSLIPSPALSIRGSVVNLPPHTTATIMLQSRDFNVVMNGAEMHKDGSFVIRDVSPGSYTISATVDGTPVPMMARESLQIGSSNVDGLRLAPQPGATVRGRLLMESRGAGRIDADVFVVLQSADDEIDASVIANGQGFSNTAHVSQDGSVEWRDVLPGKYFLQIMRENDANGDWFLKSALAGGHDVNDSGISVNDGVVTLDLVASADGGSVTGVVMDAQGQPLANAVVVAAPEARLRGRTDRFKKTISDQNGRFGLRGIRPGSYTVFAWESVDGDAYYNPEFLKSCESQGRALRIVEGDHQTLHLTAIPEPEDQP